MQGGKRNGGRKLAKLYGSLAPADKDTLLAFAEFLAARDIPQAEEIPESSEPIPIPRPQEESVVGAIKRLSHTYHMLDHSALLNGAASLMGAHVLQGRPVTQVIDELEDLFARNYAEYQEKTAPETA